MNEWGLTPEELTQINNDMPPDAKYGEVFEAISLAGQKKLLEWICQVKTCKELIDRLAGLKAKLEAK